MRVYSLTFLALLASAPAVAGKPEKPVTQEDVTASDVAATPITDLNLRKSQIPPLLTAAEERPYTLQGLATCQQLASAISEFDSILGDDVDLPRQDGQRITVGKAAQYAVGSFIPFRDVIREVSGASKHERDLQSAILAGFTRRSFLKGVGQARNCRYPARSVTLEIFSQRLAEIEARKNRGHDKQTPAVEDREKHRR